MSFLPYDSHTIPKHTLHKSQCVSSAMRQPCEAVAVVAQRCFDLNANVIRLTTLTVTANVLMSISFVYHTDHFTLPRCRANIWLVYLRRCQDSKKHKHYTCELSFFSLSLHRGGM